MNTAGGTDNDLRTILEGLHVVTNAGATNAGVALNVHEIANSDNDLLDLLSKLTGGSKDQSLTLLDSRVDLLENGDGESGSLSGTRLSLSNDIVALDNGHDSTLLNGRRALETIGVNCAGYMSVCTSDVKSQVGAGSTYHHGGARSGGSCHRKNQRSHRSWTRSDLWRAQKSAKLSWTKW